MIGFLFESFFSTCVPQLEWLAHASFLTSSMVCGFGLKPGEVFCPGPFLFVAAWEVEDSFAVIFFLTRKPRVLISFLPLFLGRPPRGGGGLRRLILVYRDEVSGEEVLDRGP